MVSTLLSETIQRVLHNARIAGRTHNLFLHTVIRCTSIISLKRYGSVPGSEPGGGGSTPPRVTKILTPYGAVW